VDLELGREVAEELGPVAEGVLVEILMRGAGEGDVLVHVFIEVSAVLELIYGVVVGTEGYNWGIGTFATEAAYMVHFCR
jgi:hypothetical protein